MRGTPRSSPQSNPPPARSNGHAQLTLVEVRVLVREDLKRSGLTEDDLYLQPRTEDLNHPGVYNPGYALVYPDPNTGEASDFARFRYLLREPGSKRPKYDQLIGTSPRAYFSRLRAWVEVFADVEQQTASVEGEKKAEAVCKAGFNCIGLGGVWNFKYGMLSLLPELERINWKGRVHILIYDSDIKDNYQVQLAEHKLASELTRRGAHVYTLHIPELNGKKTGADDFLQIKGKKAFAKLLEEAFLWQGYLLTSEALQVAIPKGERILSMNDKLFLRGQRIRRLVVQEQPDKPNGILRHAEGSVRLAEMNVELLRYLLAEADCTFAIKTKKDGSTRLVSTDPKKVWAETIKANADGLEERTPWRRLDLITSVPLLLEDGRLLEEPGYHAELRAYYQPRERFPAIPAEPTQEQAIEALNKLSDLYDEFPWANDASYSAVLSAMLSVLVRHLVPTVPLLGITAPLPGSGKSKVADTISIVATGKPATRLGYLSTEEFDKHLPVPIAEGCAVVNIDNVDHRIICSDQLSQALDAPGEVSFRILGRTKNLKIVNRTVFTATGNQLAISGLTRKAILCKLQPEVPHPELVEHSFDPVKRALQHHADYAAACLTALRYYLQKECLQPKGLGAAGSFEAWSRIVRGCLVHLGWADPWATQAMLRNEDPIAQADTELMVALLKSYSGAPPTYADKEFKNSDAFTLADIRKSVNDAWKLLNTSEGWNAEKAGHRIRHLRERPLEIEVERAGRCTTEIFDLREVGKTGGSVRYQIFRKEG